MAVGARVLASKNAVVARLSAIEELAGMSVLCSDKTGTLGIPDGYKHAQVQALIYLQLSIGGQARSPPRYKPEIDARSATLDRRAGDHLRGACARLLLLVGAGRAAGHRLRLRSDGESNMHNYNQTCVITLRCHRLRLRSDGGKRIKHA